MNFLRQIGEYRFEIADTHWDIKGYVDYSVVWVFRGRDKQACAEVLMYHPRERGKPDKLFLRYVRRYDGIKISVSKYLVNFEEVLAEIEPIHVKQG